MTPPLVWDIESEKGQREMVAWLRHEFIERGKRGLAEFEKASQAPHFQEAMEALESIVAAKLGDIAPLRARLAAGEASADEGRIAAELLGPKGRGAPKKAAHEKLRYEDGRHKGKLKDWELVAETDVPWIEGLWRANYTAPFNRADAVRFFCLMYGAGSVEDGYDEAVYNRVLAHLNRPKSRHILEVSK